MSNKPNTDHHDGPVLLPDIWKPVVGFSRYFLSWNGKVVSSISGKELKQGTSPNGYKRVLLYSDDGSGRRFSRTIHTMIMETFGGPKISELPLVRHLDDCKPNNWYGNLAYGTNSDNQFDSVNLGTHGQASKTKCSEGHSYTPENTYTYAGGRQCKICRNKHARNSHRKAAARRKADSVK